MLQAGSNQNDMKSVSMTEAQHRTALLMNQNMPGTQSHNARDFAQQMRSANFRTGSHLPEHVKMDMPKLEKRGSSLLLGQVNKRVDFKQNARAILPPSQAHGVSAGNNISKGKGDFQSIN